MLYKNGGWIYPAVFVCCHYKERLYCSVIAKSGDNRDAAISCNKNRCNPDEIASP